MSPPANQIMQNGVYGARAILGKKQSIATILYENQLYIMATNGEQASVVHVVGPNPDENGHVLLSYLFPEWTNPHSHDFLRAKFAIKGKLSSKKAEFLNEVIGDHIQPEKPFETVAINKPYVNK